MKYVRFLIAMRKIPQLLARVAVNCIEDGVARDKVHDGSVGVRLVNGRGGADHFALIKLNARLVARIEIDVTVEIKTGALEGRGQKHAHINVHKRHRFTFNMHKYTHI